MVSENSREKNKNSYILSLIERQNAQFTWGIYETETDQIIKEFIFEQDAKKFAKKLQTGHGFAGFTPRYLFNGQDAYLSLSEK